MAITLTKGTKFEQHHHSNYLVTPILIILGVVLTVGIHISPFLFNQANFQSLDTGLTNSFGFTSNFGLNYLTWLIMGITVCCAIFHVGHNRKIYFSNLSIGLFFACFILTLPLSYANAVTEESISRVSGIWIGWLFLFSLQQFKLTTHQKNTLLSFILLSSLIDVIFAYGQCISLFMPNLISSNNALPPLTYGIFHQANTLISFLSVSLLISAYLLTCQLPVAHQSQNANNTNITFKLRRFLTRAFNGFKLAFPLITLPLIWSLACNVERMIFVIAMILIGNSVFKCVTRQQFKAWITFVFLGLILGIFLAHAITLFNATPPLHGKQSASISNGVPAESATSNLSINDLSANNLSTNNLSINDLPIEEGATTNKLPQKLFDSEDLDSKSLTSTLLFANFSINRQLYKQTFDMITEQPLLGYGYGRFESEYRLYTARQHQLNSHYPSGSLNITHPQNEIMYWVVEGGITALVGILLAAIFVLREVLQLTRYLRYAIIAIFLPLLLQIILISPFYFSVLHWFVFVIFIYLTDNLSGKCQSINLSKSLTFIIKLLAISVFFCIALFFTTIGYNTNVLVKFTQNQSQERSQLLKISVPLVWKESVQRYRYNEILQQGIKNNDEEQIQTYIEWANNTIQIRPRASTYQNLIFAYTTLNNHLVVQSVTKEARYLFPTLDWHATAEPK